MRAVQPLVAHQCNPQTLRFRCQAGGTEEEQRRRRGGGRCRSSGFAHRDNLRRAGAREKYNGEVEDARCSLLYAEKII